jgi:hypothetical protein
MGLTGNGTMKRYLSLLATAAALQLAGSTGTGISQSECELSDWRAVGYEDGSQGRATHNFGTWRKRCAAHGVAPDFPAYQAGREAGLREYCQESRGFREGSQGRSYAGVCPADSEPGFLYGFRDGHALYELESGLRLADRRIRDNEARIQQIEIELADRANAIVDPTTTRDERLLLVVETTQLAEERGTRKNDIAGLRAERQRLQIELEIARRELLARR